GAGVDRLLGLRGPRLLGQGAERAPAGGHRSRVRPAHVAAAALVPPSGARPRDRRAGRRPLGPARSARGPARRRPGGADRSGRLVPSPRDHPRGPRGADREPGRRAVPVGAAGAAGARGGPRHAPEAGAVRSPAPAAGVARSDGGTGRALARAAPALLRAGGAAHRDPARLVAGRVGQPPDDRDPARAGGLVARRRLRSPRAARALAPRGAGLRPGLSLGGGAAQREGRLPPDRGACATTAGRRASGGVGPARAAARVLPRPAGDPGALRARAPGGAGPRPPPGGGRLRSRLGPPPRHAIARPRGGRRATAGAPGPPPLG